MTDPSSLSPRDRAVSAVCLRVIAAHCTEHSVSRCDVLPLTLTEIQLVKAYIKGIFEGIEELAANVETDTAPVFDARIKELLSAHLPKDPTP